MVQIYYILFVIGTVVGSLLLRCLGRGFRLRITGSKKGVKDNLILILLKEDLS